MRIVVSGLDKMDVYRRCRELEDKGYECTTPFKRIYHTRKSFNYHDDSIERYRKNNFSHMEDTVKYLAVYEGSVRA